MTTQLGDTIKALIRAHGPISVTDYFALCLAHPEHGYYRSRQPFGQGGDFITAPEISQLFGEMIGVFMVHAWQRHGTPGDIRLVEIGPGRGTMMADMLRVVARLAPDLYAGMSVHMVETSPKLRDLQRQTLAAHIGKIDWHDSFDEVPRGFILLAANELFDAIPFRQFVKTPTGFRERMVSLDADDELTFSLGVAGIDPALLPAAPAGLPDGTIFEIAPAREAVMGTICARLQEIGGSAVIIDYGYTVTAYGDTLQAVRHHEFDPPLAHPGEADLTSHVDFDRLSRTAAASGVDVNGLMHQGDFLRGLGIVERAQALGRDKDPATQNEIRLAVERLAGEGAGKMGELFKVLLLSHPRIDLRRVRPAGAS
ncbi:class I SAM-dependent methyltransferase [Rhizobium sp. YJ-22]|uniref:class I SAM-dependent methyltransferase n=1 Tax=Rhizobium sp. YJ-22 TaxID=3037556 RepID=UPI002412A822|nr:class I SAM-dependent methyltransferase [Rhizobium sp. YJ-22]MDG3576090.1 class I SAM-dependent methyltransferase [Rhizobium sp. YJ-22]